MYDEEGVQMMSRSVGGGLGWGAPGFIDDCGGMW
jgi:hypothetical protein